MKFKLFLSLLAAAVFSSAPLRAQQAPSEPSPAEAKLREALRNTMLQLKAAQDESAALQGKLAESEAGRTAAKEEGTALASKLGELAKKAAAEKEASDKAQAALQAQGAAKDGQIQQLNAALAKWKEGYNLAVKALQEKEGERVRAAEQVVVLERIIEEREAQNLALFKTADEILTRYRKFSLGDALAAKEPFTGIARSRLEAQVQDYRHKLQDGKFQAGAPAAAAETPAAPKP
jgi:hypothetical protein